MFNEIAIHIEEQLAKGSNFAIAQVIDRIAPSSGKVGDKALILDNGKLIGWIGGGCVRGIVVKEALEVIKTKKYRRIRISPEGGTRETANYKEYVMSCQSKGTVEVMIEPVLPQPELIIVGKSNIARKLALLATTADFRVTVMANDIDPQMFPSAQKIAEKVDFKQVNNHVNAYIVVTTQGDNDTESVIKALESRARYVGFVASAAKAKDIRTYLKTTTLSEKRIMDLHSPVGIDINAKLAGEVAVSILAEIIEDFRNNKSEDSACCGSTTTESNNSNEFTEEYFINPVCKVPVSKKNPKHILEYLDEKVYFCCDGCKVSFENDPEKYMQPQE